MNLWENDNEFILDNIKIIRTVQGFGIFKNSKKINRFPKKIDDKKAVW